VPVTASPLSFHPDAGSPAAPVHNSSVRVRLLLVLAGVLVVMATVSAFLALWQGGPHRAGVVTASVADVAVGHAKTISVELPDARHTQARVFLARTSAGDVHAYLAKSTHLGCRLLAPDDGHYGVGFTLTSRRYFFEDPCGGSLYSLAGKCTGGPCPRNLDGYAVEMRDDHAEIDLRTLIKGSPRGT
jgi:nitrite reductase/ring-hydroxylating ferredoxin subunit